MRYDKSVIFEQIKGREYSPDLGKMNPIEETLFPRSCHVTEMSHEQTMQAFGQSVTGVIEVHHVGSMVDATHLKYRGVRYKILDKNELRFKAVYWARSL